MDIQLRLIQKESVMDRNNYFALQKSVALFPNMELDNKKLCEDISWKDLFHNKNRICYVIETIPDFLYCGECAVKDISADVPEIEIELMREYRHQGIGYKAIIMMFNKISEKYRKQKFYAKLSRIIMQVSFYLRNLEERRQVWQRIFKYLMKEQSNLLHHIDAF